MKADEPLPLWLESIPDREPWRRGRIAICLISVLVFLAEAVLIMRSIELGDLASFLFAVGLGATAFLLLFFIWIGRNWPRWIIAPLFALWGFGHVVLGIIRGDGWVFLLGLGSLTIFSYLALAPSVYAFARRQRERIRGLEILVVGGVLALVLLSLGCSLYGFYVYDTDLEKEATGFAVTTFRQVFLYHDEEFLRANLKDGARKITPHKFLAMLTDQLGSPQWAGAPRGVFTTRLVSGGLVVTAHFEMPVLYQESAPIWVNIDVSRIGSAWQIDHLGWEYQPLKNGRR